MNLIWKRLKKLVRLLYNDLHAFQNKGILISASINVDYNGNIIHSNWGDDLNYFFLKEISIKPIILTSETIFAKYFCENYLVIGSTITMFCNKNTVIWGAGLLNEDIFHNIVFKNIRAVRGPLTQKILADAGGKCPTCYGDPALLLPLHYNATKNEKEYDIGIVPHYADIAIVKQLKNMMNAHVILTRGYENWHDFIDEILKCKCVVSSSLHGLIVAEAYGIPSLWIEIDKGESRNYFKYQDFYKSIGKSHIDKPVIVDEIMTINKLIALCSKWEPGMINIDKLISSCPFPIKL